MENIYKEKTSDFSNWMVEPYMCMNFVDIFLIIISVIEEKPDPSPVVDDQQVDVDESECVNPHPDAADHPALDVTTSNKISNELYPFIVF